MERPVMMVTIFVIAVILTIVITMYLYEFSKSGEKKIELAGQKVTVSAEIIGSSVSKMNIAKIDIEGNFTPNYMVRINIPLLLKKSGEFDKVIRMFSYPLFEVDIVTLDDSTLGVKPIVYAVIYKDGKTIYSTAGDEIIYKKNAFWINFVEFTCYNDNGEKVGVTMLSGIICGKVNNEDICFYRINIFLHSPTVSLKDEVAPELPRLPENTEID